MKTCSAFGRSKEVSYLPVLSSEACGNAYPINLLSKSLKYLKQLAEDWQSRLLWLGYCSLLCDTHSLLSWSSIIRLALQVCGKCHQPAPKLLLRWGQDAAQECTGKTMLIKTWKPSVTLPSSVPFVWRASTIVCFVNWKQAKHEAFERTSVLADCLFRMLQLMNRIYNTRSQGSDASQISVGSKFEGFATKSTCCCLAICLADTNIGPDELPDCCKPLPQYRIALEMVSSQSRSCQPATPADSVGGTGIQQLKNAGMIKNAGMMQSSTLSEDL